MLQVRNFFKENKFSEEELISIARKMEYKRLEPGDKVYKFKEESDYAYFIIKGAYHAVCRKRLDDASQGFGHKGGADRRGAASSKVHWSTPGLLTHGF